MVKPSPGVKKFLFSQGMRTPALPLEINVPKEESPLLYVEQALAIGNTSCGAIFQRENVPRMEMGRQKIA